MLGNGAAIAEIALAEIPTIAEEVASVVVPPAPGGVGGRYTGPAFPRRKKQLDELYKVADLRAPEPGPPVIDLPPPSAPEARESVLPKLIDAGPIEAAKPLVDEAKLKQEQDDEEAVIVILSRLLH